METKSCASCRKPFQPRPQVPGQAYCSSPDCQRERRLRWQRDKLRNDSDYRDNQNRAQRAWLERNPDYWRRYRETHPQRPARNRSREPADAARPVDDGFTKTPVPALQPALKAGIYRIRPLAGSRAAKRDVWTVELIALCVDCPCKVDVCKEMP